MKRRRFRAWIAEQELEGNYLPAAPTPEDLRLDDLSRDIVIGRSIEQPDSPIHISVRSGVSHVLIVGKPNSGKSVTLRRYFKEVHDFGQRNPHSKVQIVFCDLKKDVNNPQLLFGDDYVHITIHDPNKTRFALNGPPGVPSRAWGASISDVLANRLGLIVSRTCLSAVYNWVLPILNPSPVPGRPLKPPSIKLILDTLANSPASCWGEKIDYIRTLVQKLSALLVDAGGLFDADTGFDINSVLARGKHCIIDIADFEPPYLRYLIIDLIFKQTTSYRIHNHLKTDQTKVCLGCDEGDFVFSPQAQAAYSESLSPGSSGGRLLREYGVQLVVAASSLQRLDPYLVTGVTNIIAHCSADAESIRVLQRTLLLEPETVKLLPALKSGECIFREAGGVYPYPWLGKIDFIEPDHAQKSEPYDSVPFTKARGLDDLPEVQEALERRISERSKLKFRQSPKKRVSSGLYKTDRTFLSHLSLHEFEPVHRLFKRMDNPSPETQKRILKRLTDKGLIETDLVRTRPRVRIAQPTEACWKYLNAKSRYKPLRGGRIHTFLCRWTQWLYLKRGCQECACEQPYPNSNGISDVRAKKNGKLYYAEIIVDCCSNVAKHVRSCFVDSDQVEGLTILTLLKSEHAKINTIICSEPDLVFYINRISFMTAGEILKELYHEDS
ncbi:MAG: ATP-binding protein [Planctomycetota bacterium]